MIRTRTGSVALRTRLHLPQFTNRDAEVMLDVEIYPFGSRHGVFHQSRLRPLSSQQWKSASNSLRLGYAPYSGSIRVHVRGNSACVPP